MDTKVESPMSIESLKGALDKGYPVLVMYQTGPTTPESDWENEWDEGHYAVATKIEHSTLYLTDPDLAVPSGHSQLPVGEFEDRWHDVDPSGRAYRWGMIFQKQLP